MNRRTFLAASGVAMAAASGRGALPYAFDESPGWAPTRGPLRVHSRNPRYFADASGKPVDLRGTGELTCEWTHPVTGTVTPGGKVNGGVQAVRFCVPFIGPAVLFCTTT